MTPKSRLNWRAFTSFLVLFSFLVLAMSGIVLYVFPHGRVAYWVDFRLIGLNKDQWDTLHACFALLFVGAAVCHLINNWRMLWNYVKDKAQYTIRMKKALFSALAISVVFAMGSVFFIPPFKNIKDFSEHMKESWVAPFEARMPCPHAELQSIESLGDKLGFDPKEVAVDLKEAGFDMLGADESLKDIADRNGTTPAAVLHEIEPTLRGTGRGRGRGRGYGKRLKRYDGRRGLGKGEGRGLGRGRKNDTVPK